MCVPSSGEPPSEPSPCPLSPAGQRSRGRPPGTGWRQNLAASVEPLCEPLKRIRGRPRMYGSPLCEPIKRKRGRPRKYGSPLCEPIKRKRGRSQKYGSSLWPQLLAPTGEQGRGQPPGTGQRQKLAARLEERTRSPIHQQSRSFNASLLHMSSAFEDISNMGESNSAANSTMGKVGSYLVDSSLSLTLQAIMNKYGDIAKDCQLQSDYMRTLALEGICRVVQDLQNIQFTNLKEHHLKSFYSALKDAEFVKLNVRWLHQRLDEIVEAKNSVEDYKNLKDANRKNMQQQMKSIEKTLESKKVEMAKHQSVIQALEGQLASETLEIEKLKNTISDIKSKCQRFHQKRLMDGLL